MCTGAGRELETDDVAHTWGPWAPAGAAMKVSSGVPVRGSSWATSEFRGFRAARPREERVAERGGSWFAACKRAEERLIHRLPPPGTSSPKGGRTLKLSPSGLRLFSSPVGLPPRRLPVGAPTRLRHGGPCRGGPLCGAPGSTRPSAGGSVTDHLLVAVQGLLHGSTHEGGVARLL